MTKKEAPRHRGHGAKGAGTKSSLTTDILPQDADQFHPVAGPGQRLVPAPIVNMLRNRFPRIIGAVIEGDDDVYLLMPDRKGRELEALRYRASAEFMTAVRVADSGLDNLLMLVRSNGFSMTLLPPSEDES